MYLLKLAIRPWKRSLGSQILTAVAVAVLLNLTGFLYWMQWGLKPVVKRLSAEQVVTAYLDPSVEIKDEVRVLDQIREIFSGALSGAASGSMPEVRFVSTAAFVDSLKTPYPQLARELVTLGTEAQTVVPRFVSVSGVWEGDLVEKVRAVMGIEAVDSSRDRYTHIVGAFRALRWVVRLLTLGLMIALITGLIHLARTHGALHRDSVELLRYWGAGPGTLRAPGMLSGASVGLLGGVIAAIAWWQGGAWLVEQIRFLSPMLGTMPSAAFWVPWAMILGGAGAGALAGGTGFKS